MTTAPVTKKVTFTQTSIYETEGPKKGPRFEEGKTYELREDIADRWIKRNLAVTAEDGAKVSPMPGAVDERPKSAREPAAAGYQNLGTTRAAEGQK